MSALLWSLILLFHEFKIGHHHPGGASTSEEAETSVTLSTEGSSSKSRVDMVDVADPKIFLSDVKQLPVLKIERMTLRLETEEPSNTDVIMNAARAEMGETTETVEAAKQELIRVLRSDRKLNVPLDNDAWLIRFLRVKRYKIDLTYKLIKEYYEFKNINRQYSVGLIPSEVKHVFEKEILAVMPCRDQLGRRIFIMRIENWKPSECSARELFKVPVLIAEAVAYEPATQIAGVQMIVDLSGFGWEHVWQFTFDPRMAQITTDYLQHSVPFKLKGLHVINEPYIFNVVWKIFKRFLTATMRTRIHFHRNITTMYQHLAISSLPDIYGGTYPIPFISGEEWYEMLRHADREFEKINSFGVIEDISSSKAATRDSKRTGWSAVIGTKGSSHS